MTKLTIEDLKEFCLEKWGTGWIARKRNNLTVFFEATVDCYDAPEPVGTGWSGRISHWILPPKCAALMEKWYEGGWTNSLVEVKKEVVKKSLITQQEETKMNEPQIGELCWFWEREEEPQLGFLGLYYGCEDQGHPIGKVYYSSGSSLAVRGRNWRHCKSMKDDFLDGICRDMPVLYMADSLKEINKENKQC